MPLACRSISTRRPQRVHAVEHGLPEVVAALRDAALAVNSKATAEIAGQARSTAVSASRQYAACVSASAPRRCSARRGLSGELVSVHPDAELELEAARDGLLADEAQHLEVARRAPRPADS